MLKIKTAFSEGDWELDLFGSFISKSSRATMPKKFRIYNESINVHLCERRQKFVRQNFWSWGICRILTILKIATNLSYRFCLYFVCKCELLPQVHSEIFITDCTVRFRVIWGKKRPFVNFLRPPSWTHALSSAQMWPDMARAIKLEN